MQLDPLFRPQSIAVIGASEKPTIGRRLIASLDRIGFAGKVFPVNPNFSSVLGHQCWPSIAALPEIPDVALFCMAISACSMPLSPRPSAASGPR